MIQCQSPETFISTCLSKQQVLFRFLCTFPPNLYPNVHSMLSVLWRVLFWNFQIFPDSPLLLVLDIWSTRLLKLFALVALGNLRPSLRPFLIQMVHSTHCYSLHMHKIRLILPLPEIFTKSFLSLHQTGLFSQ